MAGRRSSLGAVRGSGFNAITRTLLQQAAAPVDTATINGVQVPLDEGGVPDFSGFINRAWNTLPANLRAGVPIRIESPNQMNAESGGYYKGHPISVASNGSPNGEVHISSGLQDPALINYAVAKELGQVKEPQFIGGSNGAAPKTMKDYVKSRMRANAFARLAGIENLDRTAGGQAAQSMKYGPQGDNQSDAYGLRFAADETHPGLISPQDLYGSDFAAALGRRAPGNLPAYRQAPQANIRAMQRSGLVPQGPGLPQPGLFSLLAHLGNRAQAPQAAPAAAASPVLRSFFRI